MCGINSTCSNAAVAVRADGKPTAIISWDGVRYLSTPRRKMTDDDILARALYLANHGQREVGEELLDLYCAGQNVSQ